MKTRKITLPMQFRVATVQPKTLNREKRTVEVIFTTGARVRRSSFFDGPFIEELGLGKNEVDMSRLKNGAPVLDTHGFGEKRGVAGVLGVVDSAELIPDKKGIATLRFSKRASIDDIFNDIDDNILRNVSVGYTTQEIKKVGEKDGVPIFRSTKWTPAEISMVPVGADPKAQTRAENTPTNECIFIENENETETRTSEIDEIVTHDKPIIKNKVAQSENLRETQSTGELNMDPKLVEQAKKDADKKARNEATAAEKTRSLEIRGILKKVGLAIELAEEYIEKDKTLDEVRTLVIDVLAKKDEDPKTQIRSTNQTLVGDDLSRKGRIEGMASALLHRFRPENEETKLNGKDIMLKGHKLIESGRDYAYLTLVDMARACLEGNGIATGSMPRHRIAEMALSHRGGLHSISDFAEILANVVNKTLRNGYLQAPQTFMPFTSEVFVSDFKQISRTNLGEGEKLEKLQEGSEIKRGTISEAAEKYQVEEYAKIVAISRKVIINDDLSAMTRIPERMGRRAADLESDLVWDIFKLNAAMADAIALFNAGHGNLSSAPGAPSETLLNEARAAMRRQVGLDKQEISLTPAWAFVPPAHETVMEKLLAVTRPNNASDVNPFGPQGRTTLRMDVEPRLETGTGGSLTAWFVTADKGQIDMVELARLSGSNGPQTSSREGFDVNGLEIKVMHDVGAKAIDHRGVFKNAGA